MECGICGSIQFGKIVKLKLHQQQGNDAKHERNLGCFFSVKVAFPTPSTRARKPKMPLGLYLQKIQKRAKPLKSGSGGDFATCIFCLSREKGLMSDIFAVHFRSLSLWLPLCPRITRATLAAFFGPAVQSERLLTLLQFGNDRTPVYARCRPRSNACYRCKS